MISLHMIVRDEAELLPKLLAHIKPFVEEMVIIVDDRTTDGSGRIAITHGARALPYTLNHDFGAMRNYGLEQVTQPWVLQIDADEWPITELLRWCGEFVRSDASRDVDCVSVYRQNFVDGNGIGERTYEWQHRLFRSHRRFVGRIHETVVPQKGRHVMAPKGLLLLHHKTQERQNRANEQYMEWEEQRKLVGGNE